MSALKKTLAAAAIAGSALFGTAAVADDSALRFTPEEAQTVKNYFVMDSCIQQSAQVIQLVAAQSGVQLTQEQFGQIVQTQIIPGCEQETGLVANDILAGMDALAAKYGEDNLQTVFENSIDLFQEPEAPAQQAPAPAP